MRTKPRRWFRPSLWPTVFTVPALAVLVALGVWQLQRLEAKTALLARIDARMAAPAVAMPGVIDDPGAWDYRRVTAEGVFLHERELHLTGRTYRGRAGFQIVTPLRRTDATAPGQVVLVNRGWVPLDRREPETRAEGLPAGPVSVTGVLRRPAGPGWMQPDDDPEANLWFGVDLPAMAAAAGIAPPPTLILEAAAGPEPAVLPIGGQTRLDIPNNHLQYAITWFAFAVVLAAIYILYHRRAGPA